MMTCLIVDDEPLARETLATYVSQSGLLRCLGQCRDAPEALQRLQAEPVDVLFLDINMPEVSGLSLLRSLARPPLVVFTTAYAEYAVDGFELNAVDYLLKPFSFERFMKAVSKLLDQQRLRQGPSSVLPTYLLVRTDGKTYKLAFEDLHYVHARGDYVKMHGRGKTLVCKDSLKRLSEQLPPEQFVRIHKSYLISLAQVQYIEGNQVKVGEQLLPIGASYKEGFLERLQAYGSQSF